MATSRICPHCGTVNDGNVTFCGACATRLVTTTALVPIAKKPLLPVLSTQEKATLGSMAVGVVAVALKVGAEIFKQMNRPESAALATTSQKGRDGNTVIIRRRWTEGDNQGRVRWGEEEIEIDRPAGDDTTYTVKF